MSGLVDAQARAVIRGALDRTLLVEAAAGTGKTSELVGRIAAVILSGRAQLSSIAALTFTEKAAGEMKLRIRTELDRALHDRGRSPEERARARAGLSELEAAKVGTIHGFCSDLLREHPVAACVDPGFEVADAARARALTERAFDRWFEQVLSDPPEGVRRVLQRRRIDPQATPARLQLMAAAERLIETRDFDAPYRREPFDRAAALGAIDAELHALAALHVHGRDNDPLSVALSALGRELDRARDLELDAREQWLSQLLDRKLWEGRPGRGTLYGPELARSDVVAARERARERLRACVAACDSDLAACLSRELSAVTRAYEAEKRSAGVLDFFDLLLCTRQLLQHFDAVRAELQRGLSHVFVDEFQDTDPVQSEIVLLLCADDPAERDPWRVRPVHGKLCAVGDPKQSIYRFRRADIAVYERVKQQLIAAGAELVQLSTSFRALPGIQACVNAAFAPVMTGEPGAGQAAYVPLASHRSGRSDQPDVVALAVPKPFGGWGRITKAAVSASIPSAVAAFIDWLIHDSRYVVAENGRDVPIESRHVCLLMRRFRSYKTDVTRDFLRELEGRGIPHVLSGGRSFHTREEVIALSGALTAIEWPDDALHVYASLRGPFVALSDEALFVFKEQVGHLHPLRRLSPEQLSALAPAEREVAEALALFAKLHYARNRQPIAQTVSELLHALRAHASVAFWPTGEQALGNVQQILDFARAYERKAEIASFRGFVDWLDEQAEKAETPDAAVVDERSDGVRIMTVHAAKGLEFPVVVLCDPTAPKRPMHASRFIDPERRLWAQSLCDAAPIELVEHQDAVRDHDAAELVRLAYVAATRARELLVIPAVGDGPIDGWLEVLTPALYPAPEDRRKPLESSLRVPAFGPDSVRQRGDHIPDDSVAPGVHRPLAGGHAVVWWDPNLLDVDRPGAGGVAQRDLLAADAQGGRDEAGLRAYREFRAQRERLLRERAEPTLRVQSITSAAADEARWPGGSRGSHVDGGGEAGRESAASVTDPLALEPVAVIELDSQRWLRPSGARFGTLVHAVLAHAELDASAPALEALARMLGRGLSATAEEIARASLEAGAALAHPFFERVRRAAARGQLEREAPVTLRADDGVLLDGVVDMVFREPDERGGERLVLVDFKTDVAIGDRTRYERQLAMYAQGLRRALGLPVESLLFRI